jgi:hypothetical protein
MNGARGRRSCGCEAAGNARRRRDARDSAGYVQAQQREDGGFGDAQLTAWATLALVAAGKDTGRAAEYLKQQEPGDGNRSRTARDGARRRRRPAGRPAPGPARVPAGKLVNATIVDNPGASPGG